MGLPNIIIEFKTKASTAIKRGERGVVAIMVIEKSNHGVTKIEDKTQVPADLTAENKEYVERALFSAGEISIIYSTINRLSGYDDGAVTEVKN